MDITGGTQHGEGYDLKKIFEQKIFFEQVASLLYLFKSGKKISLFV